MPSTAFSRRISLLLLLLLVASYSLMLQGLAQGTPSVTIDDPLQIYPDTLIAKRLRNTIIAQSAFVAGGLSVLYANWYADKEGVPFHFYNDAAGYNQVDKFGHAYGAYMYSMVGYRSLRRAGVSKHKALWWGGGLGMYLQTPIEIFDGLYEGWGFSWSDMAANAVGTGMVVAQEAAFDEQVVRMKYSFWRSKYARESNGYLGSSFFGSLLNDYNGHTYWLSTGVHRLSPKQANIPRWLNIAVGYGAGGMYGEFENRAFYRRVRLPDYQRYRQFYLSLDVDWEKVPTRSKVLRAVFRSMNYIKVPFPALEWNTKGEFKGRVFGF